MVKWRFWPISAVIHLTYLPLRGLHYSNDDVDWLKARDLGYGLVTISHKRQKYKAAKLQLHE